MSQYSRISSFDYFKVIAAFAIVCIHCAAFDVPEYWKLGLIVNQSARFAVPLFFLISGYFYARSIDSGRSPIKTYINTVTRLAFIFISWSVIYILYEKIAYCGSWDYCKDLSVVYRIFQSVEHMKWQLFFEGGRVHLWFLMSLIMALSICAPFLTSDVHDKKRNVVVLLIVGLFLYGINLFANSYSFLFPAFKVDFPTRFGPLVSTLFVALGIALYYYHSRIGIKMAWAILLVGFVGQIVETAILYKYFGGTTAQEFIFSTILFGLGVMLVAIKMPHIGSRGVMAGLSKYSLGIYAGHMLFVGYLKNVTSTLPLFLGQIAYPVSVFFVALCLAYLLSKSRFSAKLVVTN